MLLFFHGKTVAEAETMHCNSFNYKVILLIWWFMTFPLLLKSLTDVDSCRTIKHSDVCKCRWMTFQIKPRHMLIKSNPAVYFPTGRENPHLCKASESRHLVSLCCAGSVWTVVCLNLVEKWNNHEQIGNYKTAHCVSLSGDFRVTQCHTLSSVSLDAMMR